MKLNPKMQAKLASLKELMGQCDDSIVEPFKKKESIAAVVMPDEKEGMGEMMNEKANPLAEMEEDSGAEKPSAKDSHGLSDLDLEDLMALYEKLKGEKEAV